jgi:hypothetical protein
MEIEDARRYVVETLQHYPRDDCVWMISEEIPVVWYGLTDDAKLRKWEVEINRNRFLATHKCVIEWEEGMKPVISSITEKQGYCRDPVAGATELNDVTSKASFDDRDRESTREGTQSVNASENSGVKLQTDPQTIQTDNQTNRRSMDSAASGFDGMATSRLEDYNSEEEGLVSRRRGESAWSRMKESFRR